VTVLLALFAGCNPLPEVVVMTGVVQDAPRSLGAPVEGATVATTAPDLTAFASATTGADGAFAVDVPAGDLFYVTVSAEGHVTTAFSGTAGMDDFDAGDGYPWIADDAYMAEQRADLADCPAVDTSGGVIVGEVVLYVPGADPSSLPYLPDATVQVYDAEGGLHDACYVTADADAAEPAAATGQDGRFAVFGLPPGGAVVRVAWEGPAGNGALIDYAALVPEDGLVPLMPAYLQTAAR
jgi:hypothetical protein